MTLASILLAEKARALERGDKNMLSVDIKTAYEENDRIWLYRGDALELLHRVPDKSIDMVFADPPYFGNQSGAKISRTDNTPHQFTTDKASWAKKKAVREQIAFHYTWLEQAQRVLKDGATIWVSGTYHSIGAVNLVMQDLGFKILNDIILVKRNAPPNFKGTNFRALTETVLWAKASAAGHRKFNYWRMKEINGGKQMSNVWEYTATKNPFRHMAVKNSGIVEKAILASTEVDDVILDPFAGSGTTGFVAKSLSRQCIMFEMADQSIEICKDRLRGRYGEYEPQFDLNND